MNRVIWLGMAACLVGLAWLSGGLAWPLSPVGAEPAPTPTSISATGIPPALPHPPSKLRAIEDPMPRQGDQRLLIVLVDFPDRPGLFSGAQWRDFFLGTEGFAAYYREASYHQLRYTGDIVGLALGAPVVNGQGVAYVRLPHPITYYADGQYGYGDTFPQNGPGVVYHALEALGAAGFNFAPYADATREVNNLVVVFAGRNYNYAFDPTNTLQATGYTLRYTPEGRYTAPGGQFVESYTFCPEQTVTANAIATIGICVHEHGHSLGAPDLYDLSIETAGAGYFDLMGYGTYGAFSGRYPFHPGAFTKTFLGWLTPTIVPTGTHTLTLGTAATVAQTLKLYPQGDPSSREYFLLEYRQATGFDREWETAGLCQGLVIWHVDQSIVDAYTLVNRVNTRPSLGGPQHAGVVVVEADGRFEMLTPPLRRGECSDSWTVGQRWDRFSPASSRLWDGRDSGLAVTVVDEAAGQLTLAFSVGPVGPAFSLYFPWLTRGSVKGRLSTHGQRMRE